jgi:catechol 2,3-dioxygenase-like lactoylglutathione lyase family enzyme
MSITTEAKIKTMKPHVSLNVKNIEQSVEFYKKMLGIEPLKFIKAETTVHSILQDQTGMDSQQTRTGYAKFDIQSPPLNLVLNEIEFKSGGSLSHLGLQVESTEDVLGMREMWHKNGLSTVDEMSVNCCYAVQDKTWVKDPDGNEWEVFVVLENTENQHDTNPTSFCCVTDDKSSASSCVTPAKLVSIAR